MRRLVGSHNFLAAPSRSLVLRASVEPVSVVRDLDVYIDSDLGAATHVRRTMSRCFAAL